MEKLTKVGDIYDTNSYGKCVVVECLPNSMVTVQFENTGNTEVVSAGNIRKGATKDRTARHVHGVGMLGKGNFLSRTKIGGITREYGVWSAMMDRCYGRTDKDTARVYGDCVVSDDWQNFQVFAEWCQTQQELHHKGYALDKDILLKNNRVYGPYFCAFVPAHINSAVTLEKHTNTTGYPGVWVNGSGGFTAEITTNGSVQSLGTFKSAVIAYTVYRAMKEAYVKTLATVYKDGISEKVFEALSNWSVE